MIAFLFNYNIKKKPLFMFTYIGEFIVGAYLQLIEECDFIDYNVRPPGGGLK